MAGMSPAAIHGVATDTAASTKKWTPRTWDELGAARSRRPHN